MAVRELRPTDPPRVASERVFMYVRHRYDGLPFSALLQFFLILFFTGILDHVAAATMHWRAISTMKPSSVTYSNGTIRDRHHPLSAGIHRRAGVCATAGTERTRTGLIGGSELDVASWSTCVASDRVDELRCVRGVFHPLKFPQGFLPGRGVIGVGTGRCGERSVARRAVA